MIKDEISTNAEHLFTDKYGTVYYLEAQQTLVGITNTGYIPIKEFKKICEQIEQIVKTKMVKKLVFDKRNLTVFHQGSMKWYHIVWKPLMLKKYGLKTHRKLLPDNMVFRKSVEVGRIFIKKNNPNFNFEDFDIKYFDSIKEAIEN